MPTKKSIQCTSKTCVSVFPNPQNGGRGGYFPPKAHPIALQGQGTLLKVCHKYIINYSLLFQRIIAVQSSFVLHPNDQMNTVLFISNVHRSPM